MPKQLKYTQDQLRDIEFNAGRFLIEMIRSGATKDRSADYVVADAIEYAEVFAKKLNKLSKEEI